MNIKNIDERAATCLIYTYKTTTQNLQKIIANLTSNASFLPDEYKYKKVIIAITNAEINTIEGDHKRAIENMSYALKMLELNSSQTKGEQKILALAYLAFAKFSLYTRNNEGISYGYKALEIAIAIDYPIAKILAHNQIGLLLGYFKGDNKLALKHFLKAKELLPLSPSYAQNFAKGFIFVNIARTWSKLGEIEKSINYKLELLSDKNNHKKIDVMLVTNNNLGTDYFNLKKYSLATKYLQATLDLMDKHQIYTNKGIPLYRLGLIQLEQKNLILATAYADAIDLWLIDHKFVGGYLVSFFQLKSKIAKAKLDLEQAIFWLEKASNEQEAINKLANANNILKLEEENKFREIQKERALLEKEKIANKSTIRSQKIKLNTAIVFVILSILFSIFLYRQKMALKVAYDFISSDKKGKGTINHNAENIPKNKVVDDALKKKIIKALEVDKLFLSQDLTLKKFADHLNSNTSYVSKTINEGFNKNYNVLINEYRIEEVVNLFQSGQHNIFTIESIYKKAGFKSKSSFQKAFKAKLGVTASYYIEQLS